MKTEITINASRLDEFKAKVVKINRKAVKYGMPEISFDVGEAKKVEYITQDGYKRYFLQHPVTIYGELPIFNGWKVVASFDHTHDITLARVFGEKDVSKFKKRETPVCDHCHAHKIKRWSFIIENVESGEMMQVGKSCVKDYIPTDAEKAFRYLSWVEELSDFEEDDYGWEKSGKHEELYFDVNEVIAAGYYSIKDRGFVPSSEFENLTTRDDVLNYFNPPNKLIDDYKWEIETPEIEKFVGEFSDYYGNQAATNNFIMMVQDILSIGVVAPKNVGYIVGAIPSVLKAKEKEKEKSNLKNEWVGEVKKRQEFNVTLVRVITTQGYYGNVYIHKFLDDEGCTLIWFANGTGVEAEEGETFKIKGTVKKHDEYRGWKQTILNRVVEVK